MYIAVGFQEMYRTASLLEKGDVISVINEDEEFTVTRPLYDMETTDPGTGEVVDVAYLDLWRDDREFYIMFNEGDFTATLIRLGDDIRFDYVDVEGIEVPLTQTHIIEDIQL